MAIVLEAMPFGSPWRERQNRVQAIKCLDGTLFVDAEYSRMHRRFESKRHTIHTYSSAGLFDALLG